MASVSGLGWSILYCPQSYYYHYGLELGWFVGELWNRQVLTMRTTKYTRVTPTICGEFVYTLKYKILFLILKEKDVFLLQRMAVNLIKCSVMIGLLKICSILIYGSLISALPLMWKYTGYEGSDFKTTFYLGQIWLPNKPPGQYFGVVELAMRSKHGLHRTLNNIKQR